MITKAKEYTYTSSTGKKYATLESAQKSELAVILTGSQIDPNDKATMNTIDLLMSKSGQIVDVLTTTPTSKTKARKVNGGKKIRTAKQITPNLPGTETENDEKEEQTDQH